jgi:hypothetical protein
MTHRYHKFMYRALDRLGRRIDRMRNRHVVLEIGPAPAAMAAPRYENLIEEAIDEGPRTEMTVDELLDGLPAYDQEFLRGLLVA